MNRYNVEEPRCVLRDSRIRHSLSKTHDGEFRLETNRWGLVDLRWMLWFMLEHEMSASEVSIWSSWKRDYPGDMAIGFCEILSVAEPDDLLPIVRFTPEHDRLDVAISQDDSYRAYCAVDAILRSRNKMTELTICKGFRARAVPSSAIAEAIPLQRRA
jgi:hypothetical protein